MEMVKNLWAIEYRCDYIVAAQNHKREGSGSSEGSVFQGASECLPAWVWLWSDIRIISWKTIDNSDFQIVFHNILLSFKKIKHTSTIYIYIFYKLYTHTILISKYLNIIYI